MDEYRYSADLDFSLVSGSIEDGYEVCQIAPKSDPPFALKHAPPEPP
ncbi:MAG: hypothetical protein ACE5FQ_05685 [Thiogranum sp.]